jgi:hydrogenase nickel incorporation protein HypA/HybF
MHELSIAVSLIEGVEEEASRHPGSVQAIHLKLGPLAGVVKEALLSAYEMARAGTTLEAAALVIEEVPVVVFCKRCGERRTIESLQWLCCPVCDTPAAEIVQGRELLLVALEME